MFEGCFYLVLQGGVVHGVLFIFWKVLPVRIELHTEEEGFNVIF